MCIHITYIYIYILVYKVVHIHGPDVGPMRTSKGPFVGDSLPSMPLCATLPTPKVKAKAMRISCAYVYAHFYTIVRVTLHRLGDLLPNLRY